MWGFFGRVGPSMVTNTKDIVDQRAAFYTTVFACSGILPKKEEYKLSKLRTLFEVYLWFTYMEQNKVFEVVLCMYIDYNSGLTQYSVSRNVKSKPKLAISSFHPLKALSDVDIHIFAYKYSAASGTQLWYFEDFAINIERKKQGHAILNAMRWVLKDDKPGQYTFDFVQEYDISAKDIRDLVEDAEKLFVDKWKGLACNNSIPQREQEGLILKSVI